MKSCRVNGVNWAIFSDKYGIWFADDKYEWYEKEPSKVREDEFSELVDNFNKSLDRYDEIWFYYNPGRFHRLYKKLLNTSSLKGRIKLFTHLKDIPLTYR